MTPKHTVALFLAFVATTWLVQRWTQAGLRADLQKQDQDMAALKTAVQNQSAVLHRALGKHIPLEMPASTIDEIKRLETQVEAKAAWPKSYKEADELRQQLATVLSKIPPWAEEEFLPRLVRLRWAIDALGLLRRTDKVAAVGKVEEGLGEAIKDILDRQPDRVPEVIKTALTQELRCVQEIARKALYVTCLDKAKAALAGKEDVAEALRFLDDLVSDSGTTDESEKLRFQLQRKAVEKAAQARLELIHSSLNRAKTLPTDELRHTCLARVREAAIGLLMDLQVESAPLDSLIRDVQKCLGNCDEHLSLAVNRLQESQAKKLRKYQAWALEQIRRFDGPSGWHYENTLPWIEDQFLKKFKNAEEDAVWVPFRDFPSLVDLFAIKSGVDLTEVKEGMLSAAKRKEIYNEVYRVVGWKNAIHEEAAYRITRDGMVKFLLPINVTLLDPPIAQLHQQAFSKGWNKLEGRHDQLFVAEQCAVVKKAGIEDVP